MTQKIPPLSASQKQLLCRLENARGLNHDQLLLRRWLQEDFRLGGLNRSVHVAGTNGKGSIIVWLESLLAQKTLSSASFISPHLIFHTERFRHNRNPLDYRQFFASLRRWMPVFEARSMTMFEMDLWLALDAFLQASPDWILMETGMGGERDATTALDYPYGIISRIGLDHMDLLGSTIEEIARSKAGIIQPDMTVISAVQDQGALRILKEQADKVNARLICIDPDRPVPDGLSGMPDYQRENFLCALTLLEEAGFVFTEQELSAACRAFFWPARFELLRTDPPLILDGAHNPDGIRSLCTSLRSRNLIPQRIFFSVLADKQADQMIRILKELCTNITLVRFAYGRLADLDQLAGRFHLPVIELDEMMRHLDEPVCTAVCGSLYFCGEVLARLA